jgi:TonB family protein
MKPLVAYLVAWLFGLSAILEVCSASESEWLSLEIQADHKYQEKSLRAALTLYKRALSDAQKNNNLNQQLQSLLRLTDCSKSLQQFQSAAAYAQQSANISRQLYGPEIVIHPSIQQINNRVDYTPYIADLQRRIRKHWFPKLRTECKPIIILFTIASGGELSQLRVRLSSGNALSDRTAMRAIEEAAPFRQLPSGASESIDVQLIFNYNTLNGAAEGIVK